ncbi:ATP-binding protein [Glutamicibacter sp. NPDC087344]|uniref:sensor histidine kinase n=1 Tax=Glutamicibacter sp. NPDC087344 TaxID=3363994 RepID=UPI0037FC01F4
MAVGTSASARPRFKFSLAAQYLVLQLLLICVVLVGVVVLTVGQAIASFEESEGRRSLSAAESLAANPLLRTLLPDAQPRQGAALPAMAETVRSVSGLRFVSISTSDATIVTSSHPDEIGTKSVPPESTVLAGRAWSGDVNRGGNRVLIAQVPVYDVEGVMVGFVTVGQNYPSTEEIFSEVAPTTALVLLVSVLLGGVGSVLLSRRVKKQTLGMEPAEIAGLVEYREALLHGVREGVVSIGSDRRITLANDEARKLLQLPTRCVGRTLEELQMPGAVSQALMTEQPVPDRQMLVGERVIVFNRMLVSSSGRDLGSVTTLRDRTDLTLLEQELGDTKATTDMLRAQTHEFANQLHTISGLVQLEEYGEVVNFIDGVSFSRSRIFEEIAARITDPTIAALLIAKTSVATEKGIMMQLGEESGLERCDDELARDLTTVIGNLVDNAIDAVADASAPSIKISLTASDGLITVIVRDNGVGVTEDELGEIFTQGYSTKASSSAGGRGFGLALTRLICRRRLGDVQASNDHGACFTATLRK